MRARPTRKGLKLQAILPKRKYLFINSDNLSLPSLVTWKYLDLFRQSQAAGNQETVTVTALALCTALVSAARVHYKRCNLPQDEVEVTQQINRSLRSGARVMTFFPSTHLHVVCCFSSLLSFARFGSPFSRIHYHYSITSSTYSVLVLCSVDLVYVRVLPLRKHCTATVHLLLILN